MSASTQIERAVIEAFAPKVIRPQERQELFLSSSADIAIYGGSAFSGKTFALLLDPLRYIHLPRFRFVIFRRETPQIRNAGGLWDESMQLYPKLGSKPSQSVLEHTFPSGAHCKFAHLEHADTVYSFDGAQIPYIGFDQLEHFEASQFFYMLSRNRDPSGTIRPCIRATCNPNADSFLAEFLAWWIDPLTGYPIAERAGALRWFLREGDTILWFDTREQALASTSDPDADPISVSFIPGTIYDNRIGMDNDPTYLGKLKGMALVERERLLGGNWKIRPAAGLLFRREWINEVQHVNMDDIQAMCRGWDLAATEKKQGNNPSWTVGAKIGRYKSTKRFVVLHVDRGQFSPHKVETMIKRNANNDGRFVRIAIPQDPGQAGKDQAARFVRKLAGFDVRATPETGDKVTRFNPFSAQCEAGNVDVLKADWNDAYFACLEGFPDAMHDDDADATSRAFGELAKFGGQVDVKKGTAQAGGSPMDDDMGSPFNMHSHRD